MPIKKKKVQFQLVFKSYTDKTFVVVENLKNL